jgi:hypothetical protein
MSTFADDIAGAFLAVGKDFYREKKQRERSARATHRWTRTYRGPTLKQAVFWVLPDAAAIASGNGTYSVPARSLFYQVRPRIQQHTDKELEYGYFSQTLLTEYQERYGQLAGLVREPRGNFHEPHTGKSVPLGTVDVAHYQLPPYVFDKILYVEKQGLDGIWKEAKLGERYDLALCSSQGQPVEAVRQLFARAERGAYRLFVLHDADPAGYSIARTIGEETRRMPDHCVDVVDLGLTVADAIEHGLPTERFIRKNALPHWMPARLSAVEKDWFEGAGGYRRPWTCTRVELNAFTGPDLVSYVEAGLARAGADHKLEVPVKVIEETAKESCRTAITSWIERVLAERFDLEAMSTTLVNEFGERIVTDPAGAIDEAYEEDRSAYWRNAIESAIADGIEREDKDLRARIEPLLDGHTERDTTS